MLTKHQIDEESEELHASKYNNFIGDADIISEEDSNINISLDNSIGISFDKNIILF